MALLAHQAPTFQGTAITYTAAAVGGDTLNPASRGALRVRNAAVAGITVTIVAPGNTRYGQAEPDIPITVAAGTEVAIGPFPEGLAVDRLISITYSAVTTVTVAYS